MITDRDKEILRWIENYRAITVVQATYIFFKGNYEGCRRRLKQLEEMEILKSYVSKLTKEKVYYQEKKLKDHDLLIYDFVKEVYKKGGQLRKLKLQPRFLKDMIRPDAFVEFVWNNSLYFILLEIDLNHFTDTMKMLLYDKLYKENTLQNECYGTFPIVVIARPNLNSVRYNSSQFDAIYTTLDFKNLDNFLFL